MYYKLVVRSPLLSVLLLVVGITVLLLAVGMTLLLLAVGMTVLLLMVGMTVLVFIADITLDVLVLLKLSSLCKWNCKFLFQFDYIIPTIYSYYKSVHP